ncbi:MAG: hypothetical protein IJH39_11280 [Clostridia bacterium]|nr:hypothetical protein [Clostridia bacterium]
MAIFAAIGNAFRDGWNRNANKSKTENGLASFQANDYHFSHRPIGDKEEISRNYLNNIPFVSFTLPGRHDKNNLNNNGETLSQNSAPYDINANKEKYVENNFKIPYDVLKQVSRHYKFVYDNTATIITDYGLLEKGNEGKSGADLEVTAEAIEMPVVPSLFNPLYGLNVIGITGNTPILNSDKQGNGNANVDMDWDKGNNVHYELNYQSKYDDVSDCSIKKLVELSEKGQMGRAMYKYADFMYCKNLGKIANNRLITLRRFPVPIGDDIWNIAQYSSDGQASGTPGGADIPVDTGRLVTWLDDTNKIEDILKYDYKEGWEEKEGKFQEVNSEEDSADRGILGSIVNLANPTYRQWVGGGFAGGANGILNRFQALTGNFAFKASGSNQRHDIFTMYDQNRVYEPKGTIRQTHLYTGKLEFNQSFSLTFDYELRAYENINPRTAFLDLLNNIQQVTYRTGKWWGGQVWFAGAPGNRQGWNTANAFIDNAFDRLSDTFKMILTGDLNFGDFLGGLANNAAKFISSGLNEGAKLLNDKTARKEAGESLVKHMENLNVGPMLKGMLKNSLGRPALYCTNSILSGEPVGLWHLTVGNPRNPIMSMGNLIIENTTVQHYGPLGIDDFPTGLKVTVNLKHAKPRDMIEIGKMYTKGTMGLAVPLGRSKMSNFHKVSNTINIDALRYSTSWASPVPSYTNGIRETESK